MDVIDEVGVVLAQYEMWRLGFEADPGPSVIALLKGCTLKEHVASPLEIAVLHLLLSEVCGVRLDSLDDLFRLGGEIRAAEDELELYGQSIKHMLPWELERVPEAAIRRHEAQMAYDAILRTLAESFARVSKRGGIRLSATGPAPE